MCIKALHSRTCENAEINAKEKEMSRTDKYNEEKAGTIALMTQRTREANQYGRLGPATNLTNEKEENESLYPDSYK